MNTQKYFITPESVSEALVSIEAYYNRLRHLTSTATPSVQELKEIQNIVIQMNFALGKLSEVYLHPMAGELRDGKLS